MTTEKRIVRRSFTLTEKDLETLRLAVEKCGFVSDSEALRAMIRFFAERAQCIQTSSPP
jgi:Arc/MetJ-type ribon-helix-helix transcriptional regulator